MATATTTPGIFVQIEHLRGAEASTRPDEDDDHDDEYDDDDGDGGGGDDDAEVFGPRLKSNTPREPRPQMESLSLEISLSKSSVFWTQDCFGAFWNLFLSVVGASWDLLGPLEIS